MRDKSISHALPRARAAAVPPRRTCPDDRLVAFWGPRMAVWARSSTCPCTPATPRAGRSRVRVLLRVGRSRVRVLLRDGRPCVQVLLRVVPRAGSSRANPSRRNSSRTSPPEQGACKKGSCRVEIGPATAQVAHSLGEACGRGPPRDIRQFGRARVRGPVCASPRGRARVRGPRPRGQQPLPRNNPTPPSPSAG